MIVAQLRTRYPMAAIEVLSADPAATAHDFGVQATARGLSDVPAAIERASVVLSGGGGLLQNVTSTKSLLYYVRIINLAAAAKRPVVIFAQSIGPLDAVGKLVVRKFCKGVRHATVRDARSRELLTSLLPAVPVEQTADPVFLYDPPPAHIDWEAHGVRAGHPLVTVSLRNHPKMRDLLEPLALAIDRFIETHNAQVALLPLGGTEDAEAAAALIRRCSSRPTLLPIFDLPTASALIARSDLVVGMRLHSLILAARFGVPFLAIAYDPKVSGLLEDLHYPLDPLWEPASARKWERAKIERLVDRVWAERENLRAHLNRGAAEMQERARRNFALLDSIVGGGVP